MLEKTINFLELKSVLFLQWKVEKCESLNLLNLLNLFQFTIYNQSQWQNQSLVFFITFVQL